jgi:misacylated tRNA(Ala) deacylase
MYRRCGAQTTGASMEPGSGRLDFAAPELGAGHAEELEAEINQEVAKASPIRIEFVARGEADSDPALIRARSDLIPRSVDPLRVVDIVGLDRQADGGTHVSDTSLIGRVRVVKIENKGAANKRVRLVLED